MKRARQLVGENNARVGFFFGWNSSRVTISLHWSFCIWESAVILNLATFLI